MNEQGKLLLAIFLSLLIILGFQYLFEAPKMKEAAEKQKVSESDSFAPQNNLDNLESIKKIKFRGKSEKIAKSLIKEISHKH